MSTTKDKSIDLSVFYGTMNFGRSFSRSYTYERSKKMLYFINDYSEGAHPAVLDRLIKTNLEHLTGYGTDKYTLSATEKIRSAINTPDADVYFLTGGTQTNQIVIDCLNEDYEGVIAAASGHVAQHEAGAIEFSGHKVLTLQEKDGKISASDVDTYISGFYADENHEHMVFPGMVYISHPTEYGTLYSKKELTELSEVCRKHGIPLYLDGARLIYALATPEGDVTLPDIASLCDVFYIGGTKAGTLCGEALCFPKGAPRHFVTRIKQHGALMAKGRLCGVQFDALFDGDLYLNIGKSAINCARRIREALRERGYRFFIDSPTNQTFIILEDERLPSLSEKVKYDFWEKHDATHTVIRLCTSWATTDEDADSLINLL